MDNLFRIAYLEALALWVPLLLLSVIARPVALRNVLRWAVVASMVAAAYEAYMTFVWSPSVVGPIRIDILLVLVLLGVINLVCGLSFLHSGTILARDQERPGWVVVMGLLCLSVPVLAIVGWIGLSSNMQVMKNAADDGRRFRFEAALRDDDTQQRFFGAIHPGNNSWAGYYVGHNEDSRYQQLMINDEGRYWLYGQAMYLTQGSGQSSSENGNLFLGGAQDVTGASALYLERLANDEFKLWVKRGVNTYNETSQKLSFTKAAPPRFPQVSLAGDEVRFIGAYSVKHGARKDSFWAVQIWLWESQGKVWGRYLRDNYRLGLKHDFVSAEKIEPQCTGSCNDLNLSFPSGRGPVKLSRVSDKELKVRVAGEYDELILQRGEVVPGFMFDLAPLATAKQNQDWLEAVSTGHFNTWDLSHQTE